MFVFYPSEMSAFQIKSNQSGSYLGGLLSHLEQGQKVVADARQHGPLEQTLLGLGQHHAGQHGEHGRAQVVAGDVGEGVPQVVQHTCGGGGEGFQR